MVTKKQYETIEQKIIEYESVARFYENNREGRFQTKNNLRKIAYEIDFELEKNQTKYNSGRLSNLQSRISEFL